MAELTGSKLNRTRMVEILRNGGSVNYHGRQGNRLITRESDLPSLSELVEDGYEDAGKAQAEVDAKLAQLEEQKVRLSKGKGGNKEK